MLSGIKPMIYQTLLQNTWITLHSLARLQSTPCSQASSLLHICNKLCGFSGWSRTSHKGSKQIFGRLICQKSHCYWLKGNSLWESGTGNGLLVPGSPFSEWLGRPRASQNSEIKISHVHWSHMEDLIIKQTRRQATDKVSWVPKTLKNMPLNLRQSQGRKDSYN